MGLGGRHRSTAQFGKQINYFGSKGITKQRRVLAVLLSFSNSSSFLPAVHLDPHASCGQTTEPELPARFFLRISLEITRAAGPQWEGTSMSPERRFKTYWNLSLQNVDFLIFSFFINAPHFLYIVLALETNIRPLLFSVLLPPNRLAWASLVFSNILVSLVIIQSLKKRQAAPTGL